jgi:hypothetical protein
MVKTVYRQVDTNEEAIRLGFPNLATYRHAVRCEIEREARRECLEADARYEAEQAERRQAQGVQHIYRTSPLTPQQEAVARARAADVAARGDGQ